MKKHIVKIVLGTYAGHSYHFIRVRWRRLSRQLRRIDDSVLIKTARLPGLAAIWPPYFRERDARRYFDVGAPVQLT